MALVEHIKREREFYRLRVRNFNKEVEVRRVGVEGVVKEENKSRNGFEMCKINIYIVFACFNFSLNGKGNSKTSLCD